MTQVPDYPLDFWESADVRRVRVQKRSSILLLTFLQQINYLSQFLPLVEHASAEESTTPQGVRFSPSTG
jgi:hypothetical protein